MYELPSSMCSMMAAASIWPGWCLSLWVRWSVNSGLPFMTSAKTADMTSAKTARMLVSKRTIEAIPDPTAVPLTKARPSLGWSSKKEEGICADLKACSALRASPFGPTALELGLPVSRPAM
uniref:Uncharacterized protein n=1 Tax=Opuntia streptacantha TaxID=393608 RepID=A0A7C9DP55_OPUST